jgi:hypothetical protein
MFTQTPVGRNTNAARDTLEAAFACNPEAWEKMPALSLACVWSRAYVQD